MSYITNTSPTYICLASSIYTSYRIVYIAQNNRGVGVRDGGGGGGAGLFEALLHGRKAFPASTDVLVMPWLVTQ